MTYLYRQLKVASGKPQGAWDCFKYLNACVAKWFQDNIELLVRAVWDLPSSIGLVIFSNWTISVHLNKVYNPTLALNMYFLRSLRFL